MERINRKGTSVRCPMLRDMRFFLPFRGFLTLIARDGKSLGASSLQRVKRTWGRSLKRYGVAGCSHANRRPEANVFP